ncbi:MAG: hypothetical protein BJ554DRAFT_8468 [Olpidium bornovanus]|uniref:Uncharacterized protein n=1 Tax=Olpidium bornovanus TaxID=278681 RepID=A0A8H8DIK3_9FUNG|nr:MAG: hypothetical protein BJ554DRAFT_8468 [Olpidium bornovanus]
MRMVWATRPCTPAGLRSRSRGGTPAPVGNRLCPLLVQGTTRQIGAVVAPRDAFVGVARAAVLRGELPCDDIVGPHLELHQARRPVQNRPAVLIL